MAENLSEAKTEDLMEEAKRLHDIIYNVEMYDALDKLELESLYGELERRGYAAHEQHTVNFVSIDMSMN